MEEGDCQVKEVSVKCKVEKVDGPFIIISNFTKIHSNILFSGFILFFKYIIIQKHNHFKFNKCHFLMLPFLLLLFLFEVRVAMPPPSLLRGSGTNGTNNIAPSASIIVTSMELIWHNAWVFVGANALIAIGVHLYLTNLG